MKKDSNVLLYWVIFGIVCLTALVLMCADDARPDGIVISYDGLEDPVSFTTDQECDSGWVFFAYPLAANVYDTVHIYPDPTDSTILYGTGLVLDSVGKHFASARLWPQGSASSYYDTTIWYHTTTRQLPTIVAPPFNKTCNVAVYIRDNSGLPVSGVRVTGYLAGSGLVDSTGAAITTDQQQARTDANGRVVFTCLWSSYIIPETKWKFSTQGANVSSMTKLYTVPRQDTVTLNLGS